MAYKTLPIVLKNPKILLLGGGKVALQKAKVLQRNSIEFTLLSQEYLENFSSIKVSKLSKSFDLSDINDFTIVVDTTGSTEVMQTILKHKELYNILYSCASSPQNSDFFFSALVEYGDIKISVSSSGASPTLSKIIRDKIKDFLPDELENLQKELLQQRENGIINITQTKEKILSIFTNKKNSD